MIKNFLKQSANFALDFLYPENLYCICCGDTIENTRAFGLCDYCTEKINWTLKNPYQHIMPQFAFDDLWICCRYGFYPRRIISRLKLKKEPYIAKSVARLMAQRLLLTGEKDFVLAPVPMFLEKEQKRGFNQSDLLARQISKELNCLYYPDVLKKNIKTKSMRLLGGNGRRNNTEKVYSFSAKYLEKLKDKHIILIDDVLTTGSTANACAKVLKENYIKRVSVLCFASSQEAPIEDE